MKKLKKILKLREFVSPSSTICSASITVDFPAPFLPVRKLMSQDAVCTVRDVLEKVVTDYPVFPAKPNMEEVKRAFTVLEFLKQTPPSSAFRWRPQREWWAVLRSCSCLG